MKKTLLALVFLLSGMAYAVSPHTVTIGFSSVSGADQYYVYRGKASGVCKAGAPYAVVTGGGSTSFTDSDVNLKDGQATPNGTTAAVAAGGVAINKTGASTMTLTGPNTVTTVIDYTCYGT